MVFVRRYAFVFYCALLLTGALLLAEFILVPRLFHASRAQLLLGFSAVPDSVVDGQRINALGFTGDVPAIEKPANTVRVLVLGSSTMFNRHMAAQLKTALQKKTSRTVELLDAGLRSHTSQADVLKWQYLAHYQWDYVLFYNGINDLWANHVRPQDFYRDYRQLDPWYRRGWWLDHSVLARYGYNFLYRQRQVINQVMQERWFPAYQFVFPKKPYINAADFASLPVFARNVEQIVAESRRVGAQPVLISFASHLPENYSRQAFLDKTLDYVNPDNYDSRDVYNWGPPDYVREGLARENKLLREIARQRDVLLIDIDQQMSGRGQWFGDVCHFNAEGVAVFSAQVADAMAPLLLHDGQQ